MNSFSQSKINLFNLIYLHECNDKPAGNAFSSNKNSSHKMNKPIIFMFSGQGSQYFQMGRELYDKVQVFRIWIQKMDEMVMDYTGQSIVKLMFNENSKRGERFDRLFHTNPAIFMVQYALGQTLKGKGIFPDFLLGASLGEFVAAAQSNILSVDEILRLIIDQATIFEMEECRGRMLAIIANSYIYETIPVLYQNSELAAINHSSHFIVSGKSDRLRYIIKELKNRKIHHQLLPVSVAFHSSIIDSVKEKFLNLFQKATFRTPTIPTISCATNNILHDIVPEHYWNVIRQPILFQKTIQEIEHKTNSIFIDLGPSGTLSMFIKYLLPEKSEKFSIMTPFGQDLKNLTTIEHFLINKKRKVLVPKMIAFIFPGQGSQKIGMGRDLFDEFKEMTEKADEILGYSIKELCLEDPNNLLNQTQYTQPAIYIVNALSYFKRIKESDIKPNYAAGHSLGEYNALLAAGAFGFETGLELVVKRGLLMSRSMDGGMAAVIGLNKKRIADIISNYSLQISIANYNSSSQIVVAGKKEIIESSKNYFIKAGAKLYLPLKVSGAFHTEYMSYARDEFEQFIKTYKFFDMRIPVIANINAKPYDNDKIARNLVLQITSPVYWEDSIHYLMEQEKNIEFEEIGPGKILTNLIAKIKNEAKELYKDEIKIQIQSIESKSKIDKKAEFIIEPEALGSDTFKQDYNIKYAYVAGAMGKGIASKELVVRMAKSKLIAYLGTGGMDLKWIENSIQYIQKELNSNQAYGMNLLDNPLEEKTVDLYLKYKIRNIQAAAYLQITPALVRYRAKGLSKDTNDQVLIRNRIMAKVSRPEVAEAFLSPAPEQIVDKLKESKIISAEEARLLKMIPMADELCVEADSGGHTDQGVASALIPAMIKLKEEMMGKYKYKKSIQIGAAGGIGTPEAAAAAFILGADFILTGSINQCTVDAGTSASVKDLLNQMNVQDTAYAPAGDKFEIGSKVQVLRKGVFFHARANKLYALYQQFNTLDEIDEETRNQIQQKYFKRTFIEIFEDCKNFYPKEEIEKAEKNPKYKMALIFKWYFEYSAQLALNGNENQRVDYQIHCGPALGSFNQWVKETNLENWRNRHADDIADLLMKETAKYLTIRYNAFFKNDALR